MTGLGRWLVGILNAHIERHNVPATVEYTLPSGTHVVDQLPPVPAELLHDEAEATSTWSVWEDGARRLFWGEQAVRATSRPCWACGNPVGFHARHSPCWNLPPFKRTTPGGRCP